MVVPGATTYTMHRERELECSWQFPSSYFLKNNKKKEEKANYFFFLFYVEAKQKADKHLSLILFVFSSLAGLSSNH